MEHRNFARHVFANWNGRRRPKNYEQAFWSIVRSTTERQWEDSFKALEEQDKQDADDLKSRNPKQWTRAFQKTHAKSDAIENNLCEEFNSTILDARFKSIISMLKDIRVYVMDRIVQKRQFSNK